jgi:hypothetical protein
MTIISMAYQGRFRYGQVYGHCTIGKASSQVALSFTATLLVTVTLLVAVTPQPYFS